MDFKTILAFALMILIYIFFFQPTVPPPAQTKTDPIEQTGASPTQPTKKIGATQESEASKDQTRNSELLKKRFALESDGLLVNLNGLGQVVELRLKKYEKSFGSKESVDYSFTEAPLNRSQLLGTSGEPNWQLKAHSSSGLSLIARAGELAYEREISLSKTDPYALEVRESVLNNSASSVRLTPQLSLFHPSEYETPKPGFWATLIKPQSEIQTLVFFLDGGLNRVVLADVQNAQERQGAIQYGGYTSRYFFLGAVPVDTSMTGLSFLRLPSRSVLSSYRFSEKQLPPKESTSFSYQLYLGPKKLTYLTPMGSSLGEVVEYGSWIGPISRFLLGILNFFYGLIPNFGVAIILLTLLVKALLFPLAYKAAVSARRLQVISPRMQDIRTRYKDDKFRMQQEMMALYKTEKVNPFGGCLPLLLQFPIFIALYRLFFVSIEMRHTPFFGWIEDLSAHDPYLITPIIMVGLMWLQQRMTPMPPAMEDNEAVQMQRAMLKWMPLMFGGLMLFLPAGLNLYFLTNAGFSIVQQIYLNRHLEMKYPLPAAPKAKLA
jgi:YidC/Oxa1 family membrane protein insertase